MEGAREADKAGEGEVGRDRHGPKEVKDSQTDDNERQRQEEAGRPSEGPRTAREIEERMERGERKLG